VILTSESQVHLSASLSFLSLSVCLSNFALLTLLCSRSLRMIFTDHFSGPGGAIGQVCVCPDNNF